MNRKRLRKGDEKGAMLALSVFGVIVAIIAAGLAVDLGRLASEKRTDQKVADLAALDASRVVRTGNLAADQAAVDTAARRSADRNNFPWNNTAGGYDITTCLGKWADDGSCVADSTHVSVKVKSPFSAAFPFVGGVDSTGARATALSPTAATPEAAFSVGSNLADLDTQKSALDPILEDWLGLGSGKLSAVSYDGLAKSDVSLRVLRTELVNLGYTFADTNALLTTNITAADLLRATATALTAENNPTVAAELNEIDFSLISTADVTIGRMLNLAQPGSNGALDTRMNVFNMLVGTAQMVNGANFVDTGVSVDIPLIGIPGVSLVKVGTSVKVIEPAQMASGPVAATPTAKNSQVVVRLALEGILLGKIVNLDLSGASAQATLSAIRCDVVSPDLPGISLDPVTTSAATVGGGVLLGSSPLLGTITLSGTVAEASSAGPQVFDYSSQFAPPAGPTPTYSRHVGASSLDLSTATITASGAGALGLADQILVQTVLDALKPLLGPELNPVLQPILKALGAEVAGADLTAIWMTPTPPGCGRPQITP